MHAWNRTEPSRTEPNRTEPNRIPLLKTCSSKLETRANCEWDAIYMRRPVCSKRVAVEFQNRERFIYVQKNMYSNLHTTLFQHIRKNDQLNGNICHIRFSTWKNFIFIFLACVFFWLVCSDVIPKLNENTAHYLFSQEFF